MKAREERQQVEIPARLRADGPYSNVTIRNISTEGLMLSGPELPPVGTKVQIVRARFVIDGRVMWSTRDRCGVRSRRLLDPSALRRGFTTGIELAPISAGEALPRSERARQPPQIIEALAKVHANLLAAIAQLESVTACETVDPARLAGARWRIGRASGERLRLIENAVYPSLDGRVSQADNGKLEALRQEYAVLRAVSNAHVARWTADKAVADWAGYRRASFAMTGSMRKRVAAEKEVLYPMLERIAGE